MNSTDKFVLLAGAPIFVILVIALLLDQIRTDKPESRETSSQAITKRRHVTNAEFGDGWPLLVQDGYVYSVRLSSAGNLPRVAAIFEASGTKYGLNGTAITAGYRDINTIRIRKIQTGIVPEDTIYNYMDISFLIQLALEYENPSASRASAQTTPMPTFEGDSHGRPTMEDSRKAVDWLLEQERRRR